MEIDPDDLDRLIEVNILGSIVKDLNYTYDPIGNLLNVTGSITSEYHFDGDLAHAPSKAIYY